MTKSGQAITVRSTKALVTSNVLADVMDHMTPTVSIVTKMLPGTLKN